jgi:long-chain fatty acid transport protein
VRLLSGLACLAVLSLPLPAQADLSSVLGVTPRATAMGNAYTAVADDASALYFNPAGLARIGESYAGIAFIFSHPNLSASSADPNALGLGGADVTDDIEYGVHFAWNPKGILGQRLGLAFSTLLPHRRVLAFDVDPIAQPNFVLYDNSVQLLEIRLGAAYRIFDFLSVGASMLLLGGLDGTVRITAPFQDSSRVDPNVRTTVTMSQSLPNREFFTAGVQFYPTKELTLGVTYREPTFVQVTLPINFNLKILTSPFPTIADLDVRVKYSPAQVAFGGAYRLMDELLVSADLVWAQYSHYVLPFANVTLSGTPSGFVLLNPTSPTAILRDIVIPRVGAEWKVVPELVLRGGYSFVPSFIVRAADPVLDSDKHSFSLGVGYSLDRLILDAEGGGQHVDVLASLQMLYYSSRDTAGFTHSGEVFSTMIGAELRY